MNYLIEEQKQLKDIEHLFAELKETSGVVAVDTEFLREKTYNAKLCLLQLGIDENQYCVDVLKIDDLSAIKDLLSDQRVIKLFHAARQDMEVLYQRFGVLPKPIFDTQLAAAFCGSDMQIGYGALVQEVTGIELPKTQSRTDWTRRPLSAEQIAYAGDDVAHLHTVYEHVCNSLEASGKLAFYQEEIESYYELDKYVVDPASAYKRLSGGSLKIKQQYLLKALAEWRETMAQKRDIPRTWVLRDEQLFDLVIQQPKNEQAIRDLGVFGRKSANYMAPQVLQIMQSLTVGDELLWRKIEPLTKQEKNICSAMMKKLAGVAEKHQIAQALLGTRKNIESLYRHRQSKKLLRGWRKEKVGEPLLAYLSEQQS